MTEDGVFSNSASTQPLESSRSITQINPFAIEETPSSPETNQSSTETNLKTSQDAPSRASPRFSESNSTAEQSTQDDEMNSSFESDAKVELSIGPRGFSNNSSQRKSFKCRVQSNEVSKI
jgi:hypothetical protein